MTLQDLGNIGEFVAAIATVLTLIYLALQVRHNTRGLDQNNALLRMSFDNEIRREGNDLRSAIASDADLAAIWRRGLAGDVDLDPVETARFSLLMVSITAMLRAQFDAQRSGLFETDRGEYLRAIVATPGFRKWWARPRVLKSSSDFVEYVESLPSRRESSLGRSAV